MTDLELREMQVTIAESKLKAEKDQFEFDSKQRAMELAIKLGSDLMMTHMQAMDALATNEARLAFKIKNRKWFQRLADKLAGED